MGWVQWGDAPTWLAAVGTIGPVSVAIKLALGDSRRRARTEQRRQAELITAWVASRASRDDRDGINVRVANASHQAAYRLIISSCDATREGDRPCASRFGMMWRGRSGRNSSFARAPSRNTA